jgi:ubiquinol-cytochrome c reductase cytochrome c subunit
MRALVVAAALFVLTAAPVRAGGDAARGRVLFEESCSSCHGLEARGIPGMAPSLLDAGPASLDFYLSTGRMPLADPGREPLRSEPALSRPEIDDVIAFVGSLPGARGPAIPVVHPDRGDRADGMRSFTSYCAGCHQMAGRGGAVVGAFAPDLTQATATQIAEAVRAGPYVMPAFDERTIGAAELDSLVRYVLDVRKPVNAGGWSLGNVGPIPEGMVAWLLGAAALVLVAQALGGGREQ